MDLQIRTVRATDLSLVFDSWMKSWRVSKWAGVVPNHLYFDTQRALIEDLIARGARLVVACPDTDDDVILGWACGEEKEGKTVLHYLYVKDPYLEKFGIEAKLLEALPGDKPGFITHWLAGVWRGWKHVPEIARRKAL